MNEDDHHLPFIDIMTSAVQALPTIKEEVLKLNCNGLPDFPNKPDDDLHGPREFYAWRESFKSAQKKVKKRAALHLQVNSTLSITNNSVFEPSALQVELETLSPTFTQAVPLVAGNLPWGLEHALSSPRKKERISQPFDLTLKAVLKTQNDVGSVWLADLKHQEGATKVVMKIFDPILQVFPENDSSYDLVMRRSTVATGRWWSSRESFLREYWAYNRLQDLQGSLLPYSYGFYKASQGF